MYKKCRSILYSFDIIGSTPQLLIFNNSRYKSKFSSIISILVILFSFVYTIFSLIVYFKFDNPIVLYTKGNDNGTIRSFLAKDTFLLFQLMDIPSTKIINESIAYYKASYTNIYDNGIQEYGNINVEKCKIGKNINSKYKDFITEKANFGFPLESFYCISSKDENTNFFYQPNVGYSIINLYVIFKNNSIFTPDELQSIIVSENNFIDNNNKEKPISEGFTYQLTSSFSSSENTIISYNFQYLKYDSDDGLVFKNYKNFSGISFSDISSYRQKYVNYNKSSDINQIGTISLQINKSNYDYYKRSYQRLQSLLPEILSLINLVLEIARQVSNYLCKKVMSKDIMTSLLDNEKNYISNKHHQEIAKLLFKNKERNMRTSERKEIKDQTISKADNTHNLEILDKSKFNISKENIIINNGKQNYSNINDKLLSELSFYDVLKSYFCFKDNKSKLVNLCHNIIIEDMCFEKIIKRIYSLENISYYYSNEIKNKRFKMKKSKHKTHKKETQDSHEKEKNEDKSIRIKNNAFNNI